jgi:hypothetical protein
MARLPDHQEQDQHEHHIERRPGDTDTPAALLELGDLGRRATGRRAPGRRSTLGELPHQGLHAAHVRPQHAVREPDADQVERHRAPDPELLELPCLAAEED